MPEFKTVPLYGGALTVDIPSNFTDVSDIRQVPDNQEVYLDSDGFTSIIIELTERVGTAEAETDEAALRFHLDDIVESPEDLSIWSSNTARFTKLPGNNAAYILLASHRIPNSSARSGPLTDFTGIILMLLRLEAQKTDILITISVPHTKGDYKEEEVDLPHGKRGPLLEDASNHADRILKTLEIKNWSLFAQDD